MFAFSNEIAFVLVEQCSVNLTLFTSCVHSEKLHRKFEEKTFSTRSRDKVSDCCVACAAGKTTNAKKGIFSAFSKRKAREQREL